MKVYKFGGASVKDADGIRNLGRIIARETSDVAVVVSAMGKTTNALERVVNALWLRETEQMEREWQLIVDYHREIQAKLGVEVEIRMPDAPVSFDNYDELYDQVVSYGELLSTRIVSAYLTRVGIRNRWLDMTRLLRTDATFRAAQVDYPTTERLMQDVFRYRPTAEYANRAKISDADSVTIWKDVPGILTADPRKDPNAKLIPILSYEDAERLAESGAQIIHRKTIFPLEHKAIPLYVKPFLDPDAAGSIICKTNQKLNMPVQWGK